MFARTERLLLRPAWIEDAPALAEAIADRAIVENLATIPWPYTLEDVEDYIRTITDTEFPQFLIWARTMQSPQLIGGIGLQRDERGEVELNYWISRTYSGCGYATEAAGAVIDIARTSLGLQRIAASPIEKDVAFARVLEKLGFRRGISRMRHIPAHGIDIPYANYILRDDPSQYVEAEEPIAA